jgi:hypothetical protein
MSLERRATSVGLRDEPGWRPSRVGISRELDQSLSRDSFGHRKLGVTRKAEQVDSLAGVDQDLDKLGWLNGRKVLGEPDRRGPRRVATGAVDDVRRLIEHGGSSAMSDLRKEVAADPMRN